jgi:metacaspase-1
MPAGKSIHIAVNRVSASHYGPDVPVLQACENDAAVMKSIATRLGFRVLKELANDTATSGSVTQAIQEASASLHSGDILLLTYAGHGAQVPDRNGDEPSGWDSTWCLFDRMLVDDELAGLWGGFEAGVRVVVVSDSCSSGSVLRMMPADATLHFEAYRDTRAPSFILPPPTRMRRLPRDVATAAYGRHKEMYDAIQLRLPQGQRVGIGATVLLLAACQDNQNAGESGDNGLFTLGLKIIWDNGTFSGDYRRFLSSIASLLPNTQTPNYLLHGAPNSVFERQTPFTI